jgi:uncharacterized surface protein with fasciclin (FAS1) repeats
MTTPKTPITPRTIITGAAMLGAALVAFSLNQGGLTGRATGGAVGCGGAEPVVGQSEGALDPIQVLEPNPGPEIVIRPVVDVRLAADGQSIERFLRAALPSDESFEPIEPAPVDPAGYQGPTIVTVDVVTSLWDRFEKDGLHSFMDLAEAAGLRPIFENENAELTVFAPTNEALEQLAPQLREDENRALLQAVLLYHVAPGRRFVEEMPEDTLASSLPHQPIRFVGNRSMVGTVDGEATIIEPDRETNQGMVQIVDGVLIPHFTLPTILLQKKFTMFHAMLEVSGHLDAVSDPDSLLTVIALSDETIQAHGIEIDEIETGLGGVVRAMVENHVIYGAHTEFGDEMKTLSNLRVEKEGEQLTFSNGMQIVPQFEGSASNGPIWSTETAIDQIPIN